MSFSQELEELINKYSIENDSNTPDFILATFLCNVLASYGVAIENRDRWFGVHLEPGNKYFERED